MLLWASKFTTPKIECTCSLGKETPLGGTISFAGDSTCHATTNHIIGALYCRPTPSVR